MIAMHIPEKIHELIDKFLDGTATVQERQQLAMWYEQVTGSPLVIEVEGSKEDIQNRLRNRLAQSIGYKESIQEAPVFTIRRVAVASIILCCMATLAYIWVKKPFASNSIQKEISASKTIEHIVPGGDKAVLELADGSTIFLDSAANGNLSVQGGVRVIKVNGALQYKKDGDNNGMPLFNTIRTPRGGIYKVVLDDGTTVWLNASSALRYPTSFTGNERNVELEGEAFFSVTKDKERPFKVNVKNENEVVVLGTEFNINAYTDENSINTTLIEGQVKTKSLQKKAGYTFLQPGQQSRQSIGGNIIVQEGADVQEITAWKNGQFIFNRMPLAAIARQLSRWYDVDIIVADKIKTETFSAIVSRNKKIAEVLKIFSHSSIRYRMNEKQLVIEN